MDRHIVDTYVCAERRAWILAARLPAVHNNQGNKRLHKRVFLVVKGELSARRAFLLLRCSAHEARQQSIGLGCLRTPGPLRPTRCSRARPRHATVSGDVRVQGRVSSMAGARRCS